MRSLSTKVLVLLTLALALPLVAYVFLGAGAQRADARPRCTSPEAMDQVKRELFRRAAALRGNDHPAFVRLANHSVLRADPPVRRRSRGSGGVACSGSLGLDLPPGVQAVGDRRSFKTAGRYELVRRPTAVQLTALENVGPLVAMLSTITQTSGQAGELLLPPGENPSAGEPARTAVAVVAPVEATVAANQPSTKPADRTVAPPLDRDAGRDRKVARTSAPKQARMAPAPPRVAQRVPPQVGGVRPSFNCRYAKTGGEIAVCSDPRLANLDRAMSAQFYRALRVASPGARAMLQRSRNRFLIYRDSCPTTACIADAYGRRIREIDEIMSGRF